MGQCGKNCGKNSKFLGLFLAFFATIIIMVISVRPAFAQVSFYRPPTEEEVLSDPGYPGGESSNGCLYTREDQAGLIYFCGNIKSSVTGDPLNGITVAVYEALPTYASFFDASRLFSPTEKYGGDLIHLFSSSATNTDGHYEVSGREGKAVYIAYLCGAEQIGGVKRIEELTRSETLLDLIDCNNSSYAPPPAQLNYVDRDGFTECTANFLGSYLDWATGGVDLVYNVGSLEKPFMEAPSHVYISNFDWRFVSAVQVLSSFNAGGIIEDIGFLALGQAWDESDFTEPFGDDVEWSDMGALRRLDCETAYKPRPRVRAPGRDLDDDGIADDINLCTVEEVNYYLESLGYESSDDLYLVMNRLRFIPPWSSKLAFTRIDFRTNLRQKNESNSASLRDLGLWSNYVGTSAGIKHPGSTSVGDGEDPSVDTLISCDQLVRSYYMFEDKSSSFVASYASPGEIRRNVLEEGLLVGEEDYPVCNDLTGQFGGGLITRKQACIDLGESVLCTPSAIIPAFSGANLDPKTTEEDQDSAMYAGNNTRGNAFFAASSEQDLDEPNFGRGQVVQVDPASTVNLANGNAVTTSFLSGNSGIGSNQNYFGVFESPVSSSADSSTNVTLEEDPIVSGDATLGAMGPEAGSDYKPSSNALIKDYEIQNLGADSVSRCSISSIFEQGEDSVGAFEDITREAIAKGDTFSKTLFARLSNNFKGNEGHSSDPNVASGAFYTADSLRRDELLKKSPSRMRVTNIAVDVFDGLRSLASGSQVVDFSTLDGSIVSLLVSLRGSLGESYTKLFTDRSHDFNANELAIYVSYPLNQDNFFSFFPKPTEPWRAGNWGEHPSYPWTSVPRGETCSTFVDYKPSGSKSIEGYDEDPNFKSFSNFEERRDPDTKGVSTTCRVDSCNIKTVEFDCMGDGNIENLEVVDVEIDECSTAEFYQCAIDRESTNVIKKTRDNWKKRCREDAAETSGDKDEVIWSKSSAIPECNMDRAGSYTLIPDISYGVTNRVVQQDLIEDAVISTDNFKNATKNLSTAFAPVIGGQNIENIAASENDMTHSLQDQLPGLGAEDQDAAGRGYVEPNKNSGINPGVYTPAAVVNTDGTVKPDNTQFIHCNEIGVSLDNAVILGCDPEDYACYSCPIEEPFACSGELFSEIPNLDTIPVGYGTDNIRALLESHIASMDGGMWEIYDKVEEEYQVPCEIIAGIHYAEGGNNPEQSMFDGSFDLRNGNILEDLRQATAFLIDPKGGDGFLARLGATNLTASAEQWIGAMADWNGGGANNQCKNGGSNSRNPNNGNLLSDWPQCGNSDLNYYYGFDSAYALNEIDDNYVGMSQIVPASVSFDEPIYSDELCGRCAAGGGSFTLNGLTYSAICSMCTDPFTPIPWKAAGSFTFARYLNELIAGQDDGSCKPGDPVGTELPDAAFAGAGGACSLDGGRYTSGVPNNFQKLIESAAQAYNVPAALILGIMYGEGSLNSSWDPADVNNWSYECAEIEPCDVNNPAGQGPFNFLEYYWDADIDIRQASRIIPGQEDRKTSRCNLLDQTYGIAAALSRGAAGTSVYPAPASCFGISYTDGSSTSKFASSCNWTDSMVNTAIRQNAGKCFSNPESGVGGTAPGACNDDTCEQYDECFTSGGNPTGSCRSHSFNVWKVFLEHSKP